MTSLCYGQDVYSAYGVGELTFAPNAAVMGIGSNGLMPSFQKNISLATLQPGLEYHLPIYR